MKSRKITQTEKRQWGNKIVADKMTPLKTAYDKKCVEAFEEFYKEFMKPYVENMEKLPAHFFPTQRDFNMKFGETYHESISVEIKKAVVVPYKFVKGEHYTATIPADSFDAETIKKLKELKKEERAVSNYRKELRAELSRVMGSCNTTKQLLDVFPEVVKYIDEGEMGKFYPLTVNAENLRKLLAE